MTHATVEMLYEDVVTKEITTFSKTKLKQLAEKQGANEQVFGLTRGKPKMEYEVNRARVQLPNGHVCVVPRVKVRATFSEMTVFLANELKRNPCKMHLIRQHEMEHVHAWKSHLKGGMALMKAPLLAKFSVPRTYASQQAADQDLQHWIVGTIDPLIKQLFQTITKAQLEIDSPLSYKTVLQQLNSCPG